MDLRQQEHHDRHGGRDGLKGPERREAQERPQDAEGREGREEWEDREGHRHDGQERQDRLTGSFTEAMARLVSGVAVVSTRGADGRPCGLLVSSVCSYSVRPPSLLMSLSCSSRTLQALGDRPGAHFGVHLLGSGDAVLARVFAGTAADKFADAVWLWEGPVPRLLGVPVYLRCRTSAVFPHGDHAVVVGDVAHCAVTEGDPLVYYHRRIDWQLS